MTAASAPGVRITVASCEGYEDGAPWPLQDRVLAFKLSTRADAGDKLVLTLRNDDLALFGHPAVQYGTTLDVRWGYPGHMAPARRFYREDFRGFVELALTFSGCERPLTLEAQTRSWPDTTVNRVVEELAHEHGYGGDRLHVDAVEAATTTVNQAAETDAALLQRLARQHGREFFTDADGFHWKKPRKCRAPMSLLLYMVSPITDISFSSNLAHQVGRVDVRGRDPMQKTTIGVTRNAASAERDTLAENIEVVDPQVFATASQKQNAKAAIHPSAAATVAEAAHESDRRFSTSERGAVECRLTLVGDPRLVARQVVALEGVTPYLAGNYYVQEAEHTIDAGGYATDLVLHSDGTGAQPGHLAAPQGGSRNRQSAANGAPNSDVEIIDEQRFVATQGGGHAT